MLPRYSHSYFGNCPASHALRSAGPLLAPPIWVVLEACPHSPSAIVIAIDTLLSCLYQPTHPTLPVAPGSTHSTNPSSTSPSMPKMTMLYPPAISLRLPSLSPRFLVRQAHLKDTLKPYTKSMTDKLGSVAFSPVKSDMVGNIKVSHSPRPPKSGASPELTDTRKSVTAN